MAKLTTAERARLPASSFAYIDPKGRRLLPIHDEGHVRNALARFDQVKFDSENARNDARKRLLRAAKKYHIVPVGFITSQLDSQRNQAAAGRVAIELGRTGASGDLEDRLRVVLGDPGLRMLYWSESGGAYLDGKGKQASLPNDTTRSTVTFFEREARPMAAVVHDPAILRDPDLARTVMGAVRFVVEKERHQGGVRTTAEAAASLPTGFLTLVFLDIEGSTALVRRLGGDYARVLESARRIVAEAVRAEGGHAVETRADEAFAVFESASSAVRGAIAIQHAMAQGTWPGDAEVRVRIGMHSGATTLTENGYIGLPVHAAARVCAAAHGGQILASEDTHDACEAALGIAFRSLGHHNLSGFTQAMEIFQIDAKGLGHSFPALRVGASATTGRVS
jgi:class 3 adenylate cyclase